MSRRKYQFNERKTQKYIGEGRGRGELAAYIPWLKVYDLPSRGRSHRTWGIKTQRVHHLLSDGEWKCFLQMEVDPGVLDIREQFPLNRFETYQIARDLGYRHPTTTDGTPYVLTVDFLVTRACATGSLLDAYSFKYNPQRLTDRQWQLHEISERHLQAHGIQLGMLDQTSFNENLIRNYDSIRSCFDISNHAYFERDRIARIAYVLLNRVGCTSNPLTVVVCEVAALCATTVQVVFNVTKHLIARGALRVDLTKDLSSLRMNELHVAHEAVLPW